MRGACGEGCVGISHVLGIPRALDLQGNLENHLDMWSYQHQPRGSGERTPLSERTQDRTTYRFINLKHNFIYPSSIGGTLAPRVCT